MNDVNDVPLCRSDSALPLHFSSAIACCLPRCSCQVCLCCRYARKYESLRFFATFARKVKFPVLHSSKALLLLKSRFDRLTNRLLRWTVLIGVFCVGTVGLKVVIGSLLRVKDDVSRSAVSTAGGVFCAGELIDRLID